MAENEDGKSKEEESNKDPPTPIKRPLRPRTAYAYYVKENYRNMVEKCSTANPKEVLRRLGDEWREMPAPMKEPYLKMQRDDRIRYRDEQVIWMKAYGGRPPRTRQRRKEFDAPPRTRNSFIIFEQRIWKEMRDKYPELNQRELVRQIAERWRGMTDDEKRPYAELTAKDKARYAKAKKIFLNRRSEMSVTERLERLDEHYENERRERAQFDPQRRFIYDPPPRPQQPPMPLAALNAMNPRAQGPQPEQRELREEQNQNQQQNQRPPVFHMVLPPPPPPPQPPAPGGGA